KLVSVLEMEPNTSPNLLLAQYATLIGIDLGARVLEELVFNKRAELGGPIIICAGNNLPREVRVISPPASVDWDHTSYRVLDLDPGRFGVIDADPGADIRLEFLVSRCESQDKVPHERARINPSSRVPLCQHITKRIPQGEVTAAPKAIVKEVAFNRWTNYTRTENVTEFNAAKKSDVIFRRDSESVSEAK